MLVMFVDVCKPTGEPLNQSVILVVTLQLLFGSVWYSDNRPVSWVAGVAVAAVVAGVADILLRSMACFTNWLVIFFRNQEYLQGKNNWILIVELK